MQTFMDKVRDHEHNLARMLCALVHAFDKRSLEELEEDLHLSFYRETTLYTVCNDLNVNCRATKSEAEVLLAAFAEKLTQNGWSARLRLKGTRWTGYRLSIRIDRSRSMGCDCSCPNCAFARALELTHPHER